MQALTEYLRPLRLLTVTVLVAIALPICAAPISKDDLDAQKELLQLKIDSGKELLQKDIEVQGKRLDALDKRIDDQVSRVSDIGNAVDRFTAISGWIGILITVLLALGGLVGYFSVVAKARREAKETASNWFTENEKELRARIDSLHANACNTINDTVQGVHNSAAEAKAVIDRAQKEFGSTQPDTSPSPENDKDAQALLRRTDELKAIPENSYSFDDWNTRAFAAYKDGQLEEAALYWGNAAKIPAAGAENSAQATYNRAVTLGQMENNEEEIALYDKLIATYADDKAPALREQVAQALLNKAVRLGQMGKNEEEIALYADLIANYADDEAPALREQVAKSMFNKAVTLGLMEKTEEEIALYDELITTYADDKTPALRELVAKSMLNKAVRLGKMEKTEEEIALYDELITTYADDKTPALREQVSKSMLNKAVRLGKMENTEEEIALYDELITTYADDKTLALRELVAKSMHNKAVRLGKMEKNEEEIAIYDQLITTYADDKAPAIREQVARAMFNKGVALGRMEKTKEEIAIYGQLITTYADDKHPLLRELVASATNGMGFTYLLAAKKNWTNREKALKFLTQAEVNLQACLARKPQWGMALGNLAYVQWLLGKPQAAEQSFRGALTASEHGGEALHKGTLDDITQHSIPEDTGFRELVDRLWVEYQVSQPPST